MKQSKITTKILIVLTTALIFIMSAGNVNALTILSTDELKIDKSLIKDDVNYTLPQKIVIAPVYIPTSNFETESSEWYRGLHYFTVDKLGFSDIPFHYVVDEDGNVYEGNKGRDERQISVSGIGNNMILIAYLTEKSASKFDPRSINSLSELLLKLCNQNAINPNNIEVKGVKFVRNQATRSVTMAANDIFGIWNSSLDSIKNTIKPKYQPVEKSYNLRVDEVIVPSEPVKPGSTFIVSIRLNNLSEYGVYGGTSSELIATKSDGGASTFFLNNVWLSTSQFSILGDELALRRFEEGTFDVQLRAPLYVGEISETFTLSTPDGKNINANPFSIKVNLSAPDRPIIEIGNTETGILRVRQTPSSVGTVISQVSPGERYFKTNDAGNGWIEIELQDGQKGWVANWYTRQVYP